MCQSIINLISLKLPWLFLPHCGSQMESTTLYYSTISRTVIGKLRLVLWCLPLSLKTCIHSLGLPWRKERADSSCLTVPYAHMPSQIHTCTHTCIWNIFLFIFKKNSRRILFFFFITLSLLIDIYKEYAFNVLTPDANLLHQKIGFELVWACFCSSCIDGYPSNSASSVKHLWNVWRWVAAQIQKCCLKQKQSGLGC